jgi:hypothetical protein
VNGSSVPCRGEQPSEEIPAHRPQSACSVDGQPISEWGRVSREGVHMRDGVLPRSLILAIVMVLLIAACSSDEPAAGPVTIETEVDFSTRPVIGTFEVTEGADTLGCSNGASEDTFDDVTEDVTKVMTCSEGDTGTFTILVDPDGYDTGPGNQNGPWRILSGSADFAGLQGEGDFSSSSNGTPIGTETFTGNIEYTP